VAGDGDELPAARPHRLRQRRRADLGDGAIDDGGELVADDQRRRLGQQASQRDAELLPR
jgi:hypothetical protein